jgi:hypothetical protein
LAWNGAFPSNNCVCIQIWNMFSQVRDNLPLDKGHQKKSGKNVGSVPSALTVTELTGRMGAQSDYVVKSDLRSLKGLKMGGVTFGFRFIACIGW